MRGIERALGDTRIRMGELEEMRKADSKLASCDLGPVTSRFSNLLEQECAFR